MKKFLLTLVFVIMVGSPVQTLSGTEAVKEIEVYVCASRNAKCYHSKESCRGLGKCRSKIVIMPQKAAVNKGYRQCRICY